jgi:hypothetical protein
MAEFTGLEKFVAPESEHKKYFLPDLDRSTRAVLS